jgi:hypothetical protein
VNGHTATIRSLGITGVLLLLALVLLALVSAIFAFDRWPDSGSAGTVERVAVDRPDARRAETVLVRSRRPAPVVRGVFVARPAGAFATAPGAGDAILVDDREPVDQSDGGGFGPPPPTVPLIPPGEGPGTTRVVNTGGGPPSACTSDCQPRSLIAEATCSARDALGQAGRPLDPACEPANPEQRSFLARTVSGTVTAADELTEGVTVPAAP